MNFRALVDEARTRGRKAVQKPRTYSELAERCKVSRAHFYSLMRGEKGAADHTVARIALGLSVSQKKVRAALTKSQKEYDSQ